MKSRSEIDIKINQLIELRHDLIENNAGNITIVTLNSEIEMLEWVLGKREPIPTGDRWDAGYGYVVGHEKETLYVSINPRRQNNLLKILAKWIKKGSK